MSAPFRLRPPRSRRLVLAALATVCALGCQAAHAWLLVLGSGPARVFLHVGDGTANANNSRVNTVSVTVPLAQVGSGTPLAMTSDSVQSNSLSDTTPIHNTCPNPASQIMVGAGYRSNQGFDPASASLRVTSPTHLVSTTNPGDTIPFTEISWTVSASGSPLPGVIPAGTFAGGVQTLATVLRNTYIENCHIFSFANSAPRAPGTYTGTVTYTLTAP